MKKILLLLFISFTAAYSQENSTKNILVLENEIRDAVSNSNEMKFNFQTDIKKKNAGLAMLYSLLLPGMGELYAESYSSGKYFTIAEGALWGLYLGVNSYGNWQKDRYVSFAASNGGVNTGGKNDQYFATISEYINIDQYNNTKALERNFDEMYNSSSYNWKWTDEDRKRYRNMWVSSEQAFNNLRFVAGALVLNRIASMINAVRLVSAYNKKAQQEVSWNVSFGVSNQATLPSQLMLNFQSTF